MYKAIIIGAGPSGYTAAIRISQLGGKALLIERDLVGGICVNWGCTPSKAMITSAKYVKAVQSAAHYGVHPGDVKIDFPRIAERRDEVINRSRLEIRDLLDHWNVDVVEGSAQVVDPTHVKVGDTVYEGEHIIYASGSQPLVPNLFDEQDPSICNSNKLITIKELPEQLTIIGGGIIGLEFATMFCHFGCKVTIVEFLDRCLFSMDPEISLAITDELTKIGVKIYTGHKVLKVEQGKLTIENQQTKVIETLDSPFNLIAIGRKAVINKEEMEKMGIQATDKGIGVNEYLQTSVPNIYAVGDATGQSILAHVAIQQGIIAAEHIMQHGNRAMNYDVIPAVVYTLPEVATVGKVPTDTHGVKIVKFPFSHNLRATIEEHSAGFVKLWIDQSTQQLVAAQIIGDMAGEIIQAYANIIQLKTPIDQVANTIHAHPTYNEIVRNSLEHALGRAIEYF